MSRTPRFHRIPNSREFLVELNKTRHMTTKACAVLKINGPHYAALTKLLAAIDDVAEQITGDREYLWSANPVLPSKMRDC